MSQRYQLDIQLSVTYDPNESAHPSAWSWDELIEVPNSTITLIEWGPTQPVIRPDENNE